MMNTTTRQRGKVARLLLALSLVTGMLNNVTPAVATQQTQAENPPSLPTPVPPEVNADAPQPPLLPTAPPLADGVNSPLIQSAVSVTEAQRLRIEAPTTTEHQPPPPRKTAVRLPPFDAASVVIATSGDENNATASEVVARIDLGRSNARPGQTVAARLILSSRDVANNLQVSVVLPQGLDYMPNSSPLAQYDAATRQLRWPNLDIDATRQRADGFRLKVTAQQPQRLVLQTVVTGSTSTCCVG
ncbi:MAG: hypothetical protein HC853_01245 [Anaerolineae bacterium]|nr:hypothetical protein [Anaerolineae bacterium]